MLTNANTLCIYVGRLFSNRFSFMFRIFLPFLQPWENHWQLTVETEVKQWLVPHVVSAQQTECRTMTCPPCGLTQQIECRTWLRTGCASNYINGMFPRAVSITIWVSEIMFHWYFASTVGGVCCVDVSSCVDKYQTCTPVHILWLPSVGDTAVFVCIMILYFKELYQWLFEDQDHRTALPETSTVYVCVPEKGPVFQFPCSVMLINHPIKLTVSMGKCLFLKFQIHKTGLYCSVKLVVQSY